MAVSQLAAQAAPKTHFTKYLNLLSLEKWFKSKSPPSKILNEGKSNELENLAWYYIGSVKDVHPGGSQAVYFNRQEVRFHVSKKW